MISIGKTYCLKESVSNVDARKATVYSRDKDIDDLRKGVVVMSVAEVPGSKWGNAYYCIPRTLLFPTPAPELGNNRFKEELVIFHKDMMSLFQPMYIEEDVKKALEEGVKFLQEAGFKNPTSDIQCKNCGRSVYVGKCCNNPDIHEV